MVCPAHFDVFNSSEEHLSHTEANYGTVVVLGLKETLQINVNFLFASRSLFLK